MTVLLLAMGLWLPFTPPQLPATGIKTDVQQTSMGELQITPLPRNSLVLAWAGLQIYVDPPPAGYGGNGTGANQPRADLILMTRSNQAPPAGLRKATTQIITPGMIASGQTRTLTLPGTGVPQSLTVTAIGAGYLLDLGTSDIYLTGDGPCSALPKLSHNLIAAFLAVNTPAGTTPQTVAACARRLAPKIVYPYYAAGNGAQVVADLLKPQKNIQVRVRPLFTAR